MTTTAFTCYLQQSPVHLIQLVLVSDLVLIHQWFLFQPNLPRQTAQGLSFARAANTYMSIFYVIALFDVVNKTKEVMEVKKYFVVINPGQTSHSS